MNEDRTVVCLVCGKKFPRGVLDLARHTTAITLQHLISRKPKASYDFHCTKCELYFKTKEHLDLHLDFVCPSKSRPRQSPSVDAPATSSKPKVKKAVMEEVEQNDDEERTMECMVCGKLFPRGPIDLARHATGNVKPNMYSHILLLD